MTKISSQRSLSNFLFEVGTLRKIARSHRQALLTDDLSDNISSHSFRVAVIAWFLAKLDNANPYKTTLMAIFHDIPESRSGDQNWINKRYVKVYEEEIREQQLQSLPASEELLDVVKEYSDRKSLEAHLAKDADILDQILLLKEYAHMGNKEAKGWLGKKIEDNAQFKNLFSPNSRKLAKEIYSQKPGDWWSSLWTSARR